MAEDPQSGRWQTFKQGFSNYRAEKKQAKNANKASAAKIKADMDGVKVARMDENERRQLLQQHQEDLDKLQPKRAFLKNLSGKGGTATKAATLGIGAWLGSKFKRNSEPKKFHDTDKVWKWRFFSYIILCIVWHYGLLIQLEIPPFGKAMLNIVFALITYFWAVPQEERTSNRIWEFLVVIFILYYSVEVLGVMLVGIAPASIGAFIHGWLLNPLLTPWWLFYALFVRVQGRAWLGDIPTIVVLVLYITAGLGVGTSLAGTPLQSQLSEKGFSLDRTHIENFNDFLSRAADFWKYIWDNIVKSFKGFKLFWYKRIDIATGGDYYTGRVEQAEDEPLGVTIENVKTADYEFETDEKIVVYGTIKAHTLDDGIRIKPGCFLGYKRDYEEKYIEGNVNVGPSNDYLVFDMDEQDMDCILPPTAEVKAILEKSKTVTLTAEFNFETMAYLKTYFMYQDRLRSLQRQGLDPLNEFGIKDNNPTAVFTNGPVMLGIGTKKPPYGVAIAGLSGSSDNLLRVGVTVDNNYGWKGKIKKINQVIMVVPEELEIVNSACSHVFNKYADSTNLDSCVKDYIDYNSRPFIECADKVWQEGGDYFDKYDKEHLAQAKINNNVKTCVRKVCTKEYEGYIGYALNTAFSSKGLEDIENYKTFSCKFKVRPGTEQDLLGTAPVSVRYLRAKVRYDYEIEKSTSVRIKKDYNKYGSGIMDHSQSLYSDPQKIYETVGQKTWKSINNNPHVAAVEPCLAIALLIEASGGQEYYNKNGQQGLFTLSPKLTKKIAEKLGDTSQNLMDIDTNIKYGMELLNDLKTGSVNYLGADNTIIPANENELMILFKEAVTNDQVKYDSIKPSVKESCNQEKAYLCKEDPFYSKYHGYELTIESLKDYCKKPGTQALLEKVKDFDLIKEENPNFWSPFKSIKVTKETKDVNPSLDEDYEVKVTKTFSEDKKKIQVGVKLIKDNKEKFSKSFNLNQENSADTAWYYGDKYPFIRARLKSVNFETGDVVIDVQDFEFTIKKVEIPYNPTSLKKDVWVDSSTEETIVRALFNKPTNTLVFYDNGNNQLCTIKLTTSKTCANLPEIKVYQLNDVNDDWFEGYVEFNPQKE
jgi:hypothetical protein